jgi:hypothetical protein
MTAEQKARDMLERMEVPGAQSFSAGELVEIANTIADAERFRSLRPWDGFPFANTDTVWIEPGKSMQG